MHRDPCVAQVFDEEIVRIIHQIDAPLFEEFGYARRSPPFEIGGDHNAT